MKLLDLLNELVDFKKKYNEFCENNDSVRINSLDSFHLFDAGEVTLLAKKLNKNTTLGQRGVDFDTEWPYIYKFDFNGVEVYAIITEYEKNQIKMKGDKTA